MESTIELESVTEIYENSFNNSNLKKISFPNLKSINGPDAIANNTSLTYLNLGKVSILDDNVVGGCSSLEAVYLKNLKSFDVINKDASTIGDKSTTVKIYVRNKELKDVLDLNLKKFIVDHKAENVIFQDIFYTSEHTIDELNEVITSGDGYFKIVDDGDVLVSNSDITFKNSSSSIEEIDLTYSTLTEIPEEYFAGTNANIIRLPQSVSSFGNRVFENASSLKILDIRSIGDSGLDKIEPSTGVNKNVKIFVASDEDFNVLTKYKDKFINTHKLSNVSMGLFITTEHMTEDELKTGVLSQTTIEELKKVITNSTNYYGIVDNINALGTNAIKIQTLPDNITYLKICCINDNSPFSESFYANNLTDVYLHGIDVNIPKFTDSDIERFDVSVAAIKNGIVPDNAFKNCEALSIFNLNDSITNIGTSAFDGCQFIRFNKKSDGKFITLPNTTQKEFEFILKKPIIYTEIQDDGCCIVKSKMPFNDVINGISPKIKTFSISGLTSDNYMTVFGNNPVEGPFYNFILHGNGNMPLFTNNTTIRNIDISDYEIESLQSNCFNGCENLQSFIIPENITALGDEVFTNCRNIKNIVMKTTNIVNFGTPCSNINSECVVMVDIVNAENAKNYFENCQIITTIYYSSNNITFPIHIPSPIKIILEPDTSKPISGTLTVDYTNIDDKTQLLSVKIDNRITAIGDSAFYGCSGLTGDLIIPDSVTTINYQAFSKCSGLTSITIPNSLTNIGDKAFESCSGLTSITIPNSVTTIGDRVFHRCSGLTGDLIIPDSVTTIGDYAFSSCSGLTSITISNSVTTIGNSAFYVCPGLTGDLIIPDSVTTIGDYAFSYCSSLTSLTISNSLTAIGDTVFYGCSGLTGDLIIPDSVTAIGKDAFEKCSGLTNVKIGVSVTTIGDYAFSSCSGLTGSLIIPNLVTTIGNYAFFKCPRLTSIEIGNSVTTIGNLAFYECSHLTSVKIGNSVTTIGEKAFSHCYDLISVEIGNSVTTIGIQAFDNCTSLTSVEIGNSVTTIGNLAFYECFHLTSVKIGNSVTTIGEKAFYECSDLTGDLIIPDSVTTIKDDAFGACSSLTSVTISKFVTTLGMGAFWLCTGLKTVYCYITKNEGSFKHYLNVSVDKLYVNKNALNDIKELIKKMFGASSYEEHDV